MQRMEIGATIQQQLDHFSRRTGHGSMQRCASGAVAQVHKLGLGVEECLHTRNIAGGCRNMDRVISLGWLDAAATGAGTLQQLSNVFVTPIPCRGEQRFVAVRTSIE